MEIEYVTHASLYFRGAGCTLLTDPYYMYNPVARSTMCHFPAREIDPAAFGRIDWLYSSHEHLDHSEPATLEALREHVGTALLPAGRPELLRRFVDLGFRTELLENGETVTLPDGTRLTSFWSDPLDTALVVEMDGRVALHQNDALLTTPLLRRIAERFDIDWLFTLYTGAQEILYPLLLPRSEEELQRLGAAKEEEFFRDRLRYVDILKPRVVVPYSMTMTYVQPDQVGLNGYGRLTPPLFAERLVAARPGQACWSIAPGDVIDGVADRVRPLREVDPWGRTLDEYLDHVAQHSRELVASGVVPPRDLGDARAIDPAFFDFLVRRAHTMKHPEVHGERVAFYSEGRSETFAYVVDTMTGDVSRHPPGEPVPEAVLEITLSARYIALALAKYLDGWTLLHGLRVRFRPTRPLNLPDYVEAYFYVRLISTLFDGT